MKGRVEPRMRACSRKNPGWRGVAGQDGRDAFSFGCATFEVSCETCRRNRLMDVGYMCV